MKKANGCIEPHCLRKYSPQSNGLRVLRFFSPSDVLLLLFSSSACDDDDVDVISAAVSLNGTRRRSNEEDFKIYKTCVVAALFDQY
jgi:hypothetical protein